MKFHIPFTFSDTEVLKKRSELYGRRLKFKKGSKISENLNHCQVDITGEQYLSICIRSSIHSMIFFFMIFSTLFAFLDVTLFYVVGFGVAILFSGFIFFIQFSYPRMFIQRRQRDIERNLLSALEDILVQLNSGIPLFSVLVNISDAEYGELSEEFKKAVRKINAGSPEQEVLEELSKRNPSPFFKRTLWQISNGMNAGSDMSLVVKDSMRALSEEQVVQIQKYGSTLNPLMVFYMLAAVIVPSLSITFLTILSSMVNLSKSTAEYMFIILFILVALVQIMFLGMIRSKRPGLI